jgi:hypothetical protein
MRSARDSSKVALEQQALVYQFGPFQEFAYYYFLNYADFSACGPPAPLGYTEQLLVEVIEG